MNKILYKKEIGQKIKKFDVLGDDVGVKIILEDNTVITIKTCHYQDCCESVHGDFSNLKYHKNNIEGKKFSELIIKSVKDMGFLLSFESVLTGSNKIFVPCYNYQNGYYSANLSLEITWGEVEKSIDITGLVEDHID